MLLIGYARVSKSDGSQTVAPQRDALLEAGVAPERVYEDLACGRDDARSGLVACLKALQPGNTLVVWKLDRLGRDLRYLVNTVEDLRGCPDRHHHRQRPPGLRHLRGLRRIRARPHRGAHPRNTLTLTLTMAIAMAIAMAAMADPTAVATDVARRLGITTTTLYTYVNGDGSPKAAGRLLLPTTAEALGR